MDDSQIAILLLVVGLALLVSEIFIPSGGIIFFAALICFGASLWYAHNAWWESSPTKWWAYLAAVVLLLPTAVGAAFYVIPRTALGRKIFLEGPSLEEVTPYVSESEHLSKLVGRTAMTLSMLNPGGLVKVDGERLHCESEGMIIDPGEEVRIIAVKGNRLVVRKVAFEDRIADRRDDDEGDEDDRPLDFGILDG